MTGQTKATKWSFPTRIMFIWITHTRLILRSRFYWATRFSDERKIFGFTPNNLPQNAETSLDRDGNPFEGKADKEWLGAYGLSAQIWSEIVRTDEEMEYRLFPRLFSVAERAWHQAAWEQDYLKGKSYKAGVTHHVDAKAQNKDWICFANIPGSRELAKMEKPV